MTTELSASPVFSSDVCQKSFSKQAADVNAPSRWPTGCKKRFTSPRLPLIACGLALVVPLTGCSLDILPARSGKQATSASEGQPEAAALQTSATTTQKTDHTGTDSPAAAPSIRRLGDLQFCRIPAGEFVMGADHRTLPAAITAGERPQHRVEISSDFWMSRTEVTVGQFRRFVSETGYRTEAERTPLLCSSLNLRTGEVRQLPETRWNAPGFVQSEHHPVVCVSRNDAVAFCQWLSKLHDQQVRLPTEAEWEYACRAGTTTMFSTGDSPASLQGFANVADASLAAACPAAGGIAPWDDGWAFTAPVGSFAPNPFGLYDMHGNVGEWCSDWYDAAWYSRSARRDPTGPASTRSFYVVRGGSWYNTATSCRSSGRHDGVPTMPSTTNGFRVVLASRRP